jgi:hypothetical protein
MLVNDYHLDKRRGFSLNVAVNSMSKSGIEHQLHTQEGNILFIEQLETKITPSSNSL